MASAIFLTRPQAVSVVWIWARLSHVQTGACMPMAVWLVCTHASSYSAELPLWRVCAFSCACAVIPVRLGRHFLQLVSVIASQSRERASFETSTLTAKAFPKDRLFDIAWPQLVRLTFGMIVVIFTYQEGFYWYFFRKQLPPNYRNHSTNREHFIQVQIWTALDLRLLLSAPVWGWTCLVVTLIRVSSETCLSAVCMSF